MDNYIEKVKRTECDYNEDTDARLLSLIRVLHGAMGLCSETGEFVDRLKRRIYYGEETDWTNLKEEAGDLLWYIAIIIDSCGTTFEQCMEKNIAKLKARYPEKFTEEDALNRDLREERKVLEDGQE